jgi:hypothetical protein
VAVISVRFSEFWNNRDCRIVVAQIVKGEQRPWLFYFPLLLTLHQA